MSEPAFIPARWTGEAFQPVPKFAAYARQTYEVDEVYRLTAEGERSARSHSHYFAVVNEAFKNLPWDAAERFPTSEHLRKWCLIRAGFRNEDTFVCGSKAEAVRFAAFVKPIDSYRVVIVRECTVHVLTAKSQSARAMGKAEFQRSKEAVLAILSDMIGVETKALEKAA